MLQQCIMMLSHLSSNSVISNQILVTMEFKAAAAMRIELVVSLALNRDAHYGPLIANPRHICMCLPLESSLNSI